MRASPHGSATSFICLMRSRVTPAPPGGTLDRRTQLAVERALMIVCEAVRRLADAEVLIESEDETRSIRAFANRLRHEYDVVDPVVIREVVDASLPSLRQAAADGLARTAALAVRPPSAS